MTDKDKGSKPLLSLKGLLPVRGTPWGTMSVVLAGAFFIGASQNIMAPNLTAIAHSFGLSSKERDVVLGGWMSTAFFVIGGPASLIFGTLADRIQRKQLFLVLIGLATLVIFATACAWALYQLLVLRVLLGVVYASLNPVLFSLIGDLFPPSSRPAMASAVSLAVGGGTAIGQIVAGALSGFGMGWRTPYFIISVGCVIASFFVWNYAVEPQRGGAEKEPTSPSHTAATGSTSSQSTTGSKGDAGTSEKAVAWDEFRNQLMLSLSSLRLQLRRSLAIKTNQLVFLQGIFGTIPWSVITVFLPDYLAQEQGFSIGHATFFVMLFGIGAAVGGVVGGSVVGNMLYKKGPQYVPMVCGAIQALSALPMLYIINMPPVTAVAATDMDGILKDAPVHSPVLSYIVAILAGLMAAVTGPNLKAMLMNVNTPQTRGSVFTFANICDSVSKGFAPYILGLMISWTNFSRSSVFTIALLGWVVSGAMIGAISLYVADDESGARGRAATTAGADREHATSASTPPIHKTRSHASAT
jgi:MFS family permease